MTYKLAHDGNSPTVRQIMERCDISSTSVVAYNLGRLVADGRIRLSGDGVAARSIEVVGGRWTVSDDVAETIEQIQEAPKPVRRETPVPSQTQREILKRLNAGHVLYFRIHPQSRDAKAWFRKPDQKVGERTFYALRDQRWIAMASNNGATSCWSISPAGQKALEIAA